MVLALIALLFQFSSLGLEDLDRCWTALALAGVVALRVVVERPDVQHATAWEVVTVRGVFPVQFNPDVAPLSIIVFEFEKGAIWESESKRSGDLHFGSRPAWLGALVYPQSGHLASCQHNNRSPRLFFLHHPKIPKRPSNQNKKRDQPIPHRRIAIKKPAHPHPHRLSSFLHLANLPTNLPPC